MVESGIEVYAMKQESTSFGGSHIHITKVICSSQSYAEHTDWGRRTDVETSSSPHHRYSQSR